MKSGANLSHLAVACGTEGPANPLRAAPQVTYRRGAGRWLHWFESNFAYNIFSHMLLVGNNMASNLLGSP